MYQHTSKEDFISFFTRFKGEDAPQKRKPWKPIPRRKPPNKKGRRIVIAVFIVLCIILTYLLF